MLGWLKPHEFDWLLGEKPVARIGALFVYNLVPDDSWASTLACDRP